eukprot:TCALIF_13238-PA protein Name:"Protein of unknown function" AED:0.39 eAED:0.39 QI:0/0.33/0/0.5/0.33/0.25/4/459/173
MAEGNYDHDLPFLQYLVPEIIPGLPRRGRPCPSPAGQVSWDNGSPPTLNRFHSNSYESLNSLGSESSALMPVVPYESLPEHVWRSNEGYGSINNETDVLDHLAPSRSPRLWCQGLKMAGLIILLTTFLFYAIGHVFKICMHWDLTQLVNLMDVYKSYIVVAYIGAIVVGFMFG